MSRTRCGPGTSQLIDRSVAATRTSLKHAKHGTKRASAAAARCTAQIGSVDETGSERPSLSSGELPSLKQLGANKSCACRKTSTARHQPAERLRPHEATPTSSQRREAVSQPWKRRSHDDTSEQSPSQTSQPWKRLSHDDTSEQSPTSQTSRQPLWDTLVGVFRGNPCDASIVSLALPAVLALAADPLLQVVDTVFVGQAGSDALAALGINSALFTLSFVVFNFLATATTPLIASALAAKDSGRAGTVTGQALLLASLLGCSLAVALHFGADEALALMGADSTASPAMFSLAKDFLLIRAAAAPAALLITVGQGVFRGLKDMRTPLNITLISNGVNLALDVGLIMGLGWGVKGAATATVTAEWTAAIAYLSLLWGRREALGGSAALRAGVATPSLAAAVREATPFLAAGGAVLLRTAALLGTKTLASATAARLGAVPIASHQVAMQLWLLSSFIVDSLAVAGQTLIATELGKGDVASARATADRLLQLGIAAGVVLAAGFGAASPIIPQIFSNDPAVKDSIAHILPLAVGMLPINAAVYVLDGVLVGASDFRWMAAAMGVSAAAAVGLLLGVEPLDAGLQGVWGALALLMAGRLCTLLWRFNAADGPLSLSETRAGDSATTIDVGQASFRDAKANVKPVIPRMESRTFGWSVDDDGSGEEETCVDDASCKENTLVVHKPGETVKNDDGVRTEAVE